MEVDAPATIPSGVDVLISETTNSGVSACPDSVGVDVVVGFAVAVFVGVDVAVLIGVDVAVAVLIAVTIGVEVVVGTGVEVGSKIFVLNSLLP